MDLEQKNLAFLKDYHPDLYRAALRTPILNYALQPSKKGPLTMTHRVNGEDFFLHSRFHPEDEALKMVQKADIKADHFLALGLGAGHHLAALLALKPPDSRVLLVEPDLEVFRLSLQSLDWRAILNRKDFLFCFGRDLNAVAGAVQAFVDVGTFFKLEKIELTPALRFHDAFFRAVYETVDKEIKTIFYDFKTRLAEDAMTPRNILKNTGHLLRVRPVRRLRDVFRGVPGFIVSAGPSLDKNILRLKKIRDRAVIIAVDTALKPLLKHGIQPHFTISADPSWKNYLHLQGTEGKMSYFLVGDVSISSQAYSDFRENLFAASLGKPLVRGIENAAGEIGELDAWGSVISMAVSFALYTGLEPVVFLGQDFAFTDNRNHCRGTSWEENWLANAKDLDNLQRRERNSMDSIANVREVRDIYNRPVNSSDKLQLYKNYLTRILTTRKDRRFINATEGGSLREIPQAPLQKVIREYVLHRPPMDFEPFRQLPPLDSPAARRRLRDYYREKSDFFRKYAQRIRDFIPRLDPPPAASLHRISELLTESDKLKTALYKNPENGELLEMWSQGPIYEFLRKWAPLKHEPLTESNHDNFLDMYREYFKKLQPLADNIREAFDAGLEALSAQHAES